MGMFDEIKCRLALPLPDFQDNVFQTKDTPAQFMDHYEIREDGTLWHEEYDIEDRSDPTAEGIQRLIGSLTRVNPRWVQLVEFDGALSFYNTLGKFYSGWIEFMAVFIDGKVAKLKLVRHTPIDPTAEQKREADITSRLKSVVEDSKQCHPGSQTS